MSNKKMEKIMGNLRWLGFKEMENLRSLETGGITGASESPR